MDEMNEPRVTQIKNGWAAHGDGWAVHGATQEEAIALFHQREHFYRELDASVTSEDADTDTRVCKHCGITLHRMVMWIPPLQVPTTRHEQVTFTVAGHMHEPAESDEQKA